ncbi:MAG: hypothetical protein WA766_11725 [Candidatus Acidiferrales bacterium]
MANDQRIAELSLQVNSQAFLTAAAGKKELAIVSPCSNCQNFAQSSSANPDPHQPMCPRRLWITQNQNNPNTVDPVLYTTGTSNPNTLANPVIDPTTGNYVVWVAAVEDNPGIINEQTGDSITPGILDPNFNNLYIQCRLYPYVPEEHHDTLRANGAFQEGDKITAVTHRMPPINPTVTYAGQAGTPMQGTTMFQSTPIAGTVKKTTFGYYFQTTNPDDHGIVPS